MDLDSLLQPVAVEAFFREHWGRSALLLSGRDYVPLLTLDEADGVFFLGRPSRDDVIVTRDGSLVELPAVESEDALVYQLYGAYGRGSVIRLRNLQKYRSTVAALCARVERRLSHRVTADLILTPRGAVGPPLRGDAFVLQISGRCHGLDPGTLMYLPRIEEISPEPSEDGACFISLGVEPYTLETLLSLLARQCPQLQVPLPPGFADDPAALAGAKETLLSGLQKLLETADPARAVEALRVGWAAPPDGHFESLSAAVDDATLVEKRTPCTLHSERNGQAVLEFPAGSLRGDAEAMRFVERALGPFRAGDVPGEAPSTLVRRLIQGGLLRVSSRPS